MCYFGVNVPFNDGFKNGCVNDLGISGLWMVVSNKMVFVYVWVFSRKWFRVNDLYLNGYTWFFKQMNLVHMWLFSRKF